MRNARHLLYITMILCPLLAAAQDKLATRNGVITFFSSTPMEDITAVNSKVASVLVPSSGAIEFSALVKAFEFRKAMMQEHFNEDYMESDKFPKAFFKGKVMPPTGDDLSRPGIHAVSVEGDLTMHGVTRHLTVPATLTTAADGSVKAVCDFKVKPIDYGITVPSVVREKIADTLDLKVQITYIKL
ncbi:MAG: YceI family protein [Flavobacteriales bacterium]